LAQEGARVAQVGIPQAILQQDHQRELGEIVAGEDVDRAVLDHLARRAQTIAVEAAAVGDAEHVGHDGPSYARRLRAVNLRATPRPTLACGAVPTPPCPRRPT